MERYHPREGLIALIIAGVLWSIFVLNDMLGWIPAGLFHADGAGMKFHVLYALQSLFTGGAEKPLWSAAGAMSGQSWLLLTLALPSSAVAGWCLRARPTFSAIDHGSIEDAREAMESSSLLRTAGTGVADAHTAAIIDSVIGAEQTIDANTVESALGQMGAMAAEMPAEVKTESKPVSAAVEKAATALESMVTAVKTTVEEKPVVPAAAQKAKSILAKVGDIGGKVAEKATETAVVVKEKATESAVVVKEKAVAVKEKAVEIPQVVKEKVVHKPVAIPRRQRSVEATVMPVRPEGLPSIAEWDPQLQGWTMLGKPISNVAPPETHAKPDWTQSEPEPEPVEVPVIEEPEPQPEPEPEPVQVPAVSHRKPPVIPQLP